MPKYRVMGGVPVVLFHRLRLAGEIVELHESQAAQVEAIASGTLVRIDPAPQPETEPAADLEIEEAPAAEETPVAVGPEEVEAAAEPLAANAICEREALRSKRFAGSEPATVESEPVVIAPDEPPLVIRPVRHKRSRR